GGLGRDLAHHLGAHVLELVVERDLLGDGDAVLGDAGSAEALVDHDVAALGAERDLHGIVENVDAAQHLVARVNREAYFLGSHFRLSLLCDLKLSSGGERPLRLDESGVRLGGRQAAFLRAASWTSTPIMSLSFMMRYSVPSIFPSVPDHLPNSPRSPTFTSIGMSLPVSSRPPGPTAMISPCCGFSLAVSGMMMPPAVFSSASMRLTTTRS